MKTTITAAQCKRLKKLQEAEKKAYAARAAYQAKLQAACAHSLTIPESSGYRDTLGNFDGSRGTTTWTCILCGHRVLSIDGDRRDKVPDRVSRSALYVPGSLGVGDVRQVILTYAPQTPAQAKALLNKKFPTVASSNAHLLS